MYFREPYVRPILDDAKRSTFRDRPPAAKVGETFSACTRRRGAFAQLKVTAVEEVYVDQITDEMAYVNGFPDAEHQREQLAKTYPGTERVFRVSFERVT